jgi:DNA-binding transcriptional ArsR family regulator
MTTVKASRRIYRIQAEILKALAHPVRLEILNLIGSGEMSFGKLLLALGIPKTNLSQHLAILRKTHIVTDRRDGVKMLYRLAFPEIAEACHSVGEALARHFIHVGEQARVLLREAGRL